MTATMTTTTGLYDDDDDDDDEMMMMMTMNDDDDEMMMMKSGEFRRAKTTPKVPTFRVRWTSSQEIAKGPQG